MIKSMTPNMRLQKLLVSLASSSRENFLYMEWMERFATEIATEMILSLQEDNLKHNTPDGAFRRGCCVSLSFLPMILFYRDLQITEGIKREYLGNISGIKRE